MTTILSKYELIDTISSKIINISLAISQLSGKIRETESQYSDIESDIYNWSMRFLRLDLENDFQE